MVLRKRSKGSNFIYNPRENSGASPCWSNWIQIVGGVVVIL